MSVLSFGEFMDRVSLQLMSSLWSGKTHVPGLHISQSKVFFARGPKRAFSGTSMTQAANAVSWAAQSEAGLSGGLSLLWSRVST